MNIDGFVSIECDYVSCVCWIGMMGGYGAVGVIWYCACVRVSDVNTVLFKSCVNYEL